LRHFEGVPLPGLPAIHGGFYRVASAGTDVTVADTAPTPDHWNLAAAELPGDGG
jgi:hypothetical protein